MPRMMKVLDGPCFRKLVFSSELLNEVGYTVPFTMDQKSPEISPTDKDPHKFWVSIKSIGCFNDCVDDFVIIATQMGFAHAVPVTRLDWYYVIRYNVRTRKGHCIEYTKEEFFAEQIIRNMFG